MVQKKCNKCQVNKPLDCFHKCSRNKDGKDTICIECINVTKRAKYDANKEKYNTYKREYFSNNKELRKSMSHKWYEENKEEILAGWKVLRDKNPEIHRRQNSKYYSENKEKVMSRNNKNTKKRLEIDPMFRITKNLRGRMNSVLIGASKSANTLKLLDCSLEYYKKYLEKQFRDGMSWENYGYYWHIDHIKPCALFNLLLDDEQKKCFHHTNTQPLLAKENLKKHCKFKTNELPL